MEAAAAFRISLVAVLCADDKALIAKEKVRIGFIGTGSRGQYHLNNLKTIPCAEVVALCDNYPPHLKEASALYPKDKDV